MTFEEGLVKLVGRARLATIGLWAFAAVAALTVAGELLELGGVVSLATDQGALALTVALIYLAYTVMFIASAVLVGMWIYRAHANLREGGADGLEFTPGWAVGWYFVPFANLVKPFQAMRELWTTSHAEVDRFGGEAPSEVKTWWGAWIVGNILNSISVRIQLMGGGEGSSATVSTAIGLVAGLATIAAAVLLLKIIASVTAAQRGGLAASAVFA